MAWQPQQEPLRQLAGYLRDSLSGHNQNAQKYATMVWKPPLRPGLVLPKIWAQSDTRLSMMAADSLRPQTDALPGQVVTRHHQLPSLYLFESTVADRV